MRLWFAIICTAFFSFPFIPPHSSAQELWLKEYYSERHPVQLSGFNVFDETRYAVAGWEKESNGKRVGTEARVWFIDSAGIPDRAFRVDAGGTTTIHAVYPAMDGGLLFRGVRDGKYWIGRSNSEGEMVWAKTIDWSGLKIICGANGGFFIHRSEYRRYDRVAYLDGDGEIVWMREYMFPFLNHSYYEGHGLADLYRTRDGSLLFIGSYGTLLLPKYGIGQTVMYVGKILQNGTVEWMRYYFNNSYDPFNYSLGGIAVTELWGGDLAFIARKVYRTLDTRTFRYIMRADSSGELQWARKESSNGENLVRGQFILSSIIGTTDNGIFTGGRFFDSEGEVYRLGAIKFSENGTIEWQRSFTHGFTVDESIVRTLPTSDGSLFGQLSYRIEGSGGPALQFDLLSYLDASSRFTETTGICDVQTGNAEFVQDDDLSSGGKQLVEYTELSDQSVFDDLEVVLISDPVHAENGCFVISAVDEERGAVPAHSIAPNPVTKGGTVWIELPGIFADATVVIVDANGREVRRVTESELHPASPESTVVAVETEGLAAGVYLIRVEREGGIITARIVIQ